MERRRRDRRNRILTTPGKNANGRRVSNVMQVSCEPEMVSDKWYGRGADDVIRSRYPGRSIRQPVSDRKQPRQDGPFSREGVDKTAGRIVLGLVALLLLGLLLADISEMYNTSSRVKLIQQEINQAKVLQEDLRRDLTLAETRVNVGYQAAQMGMVAQSSVDVISITLPTTVTASADAGLPTDRLAAITGD